MRKGRVVIGVFLIIGFVLVGSLFVSKTRVETPKKNVHGQAGVVEGYFYPDISIHKTDENGNFLSGVTFKMSAWNNAYTINLTEDQDYQDYYARYNTDYNYSAQALSVLTQDQKNIVDGIKTTEDLRRYKNNPLFEDCWTDGGGTRGANNKVTCTLHFPTLFTVEEVTVPNGYGKDKIYVPGSVYLSYEIMDYGELPEDDGSSYNSSFDYYVRNNEYSLNLDRVEVATVGIAAYFRYGEVDPARILDTDMNNSINYIMEHVVMDHQCDGPVAADIIDGSLKAVLPTRGGGATYDTVSLNPCNSIYWINKKGTVSLELSSYVNNQQEITTYYNNNIEYKIYIANTGDLDAIDSVVTAKLPEGFVYVEGSASRGGVYENGEIRWTLPRISVHETDTLTYSAYAPTGVKTGSYETQVSATNSEIQTRIEANKTVVKLHMVNPNTAAPIGMVLLVLLLNIEVMIIIHQRKQTEQLQKEQQ